MSCYGNEWKRKKRRRKSKKEIFEARIRCDEETINRVIQVGKKFAANRKQEKISDKFCILRDSFCPLYYSAEAIIRRIAAAYYGGACNGCFTKIYK